MKHNKLIQIVLATLILVTTSAENNVCHCPHVCDHPTAPLCEMTINGSVPCKARIDHFRKYHTCDAQGW